MTAPGELFDISGQTALVTGSSRGIGYAFAEALLRAGCTVVLNGRDHQRLDERRRRLPRELMASAYAVAFDNSDAAAVAAGVARAEDVAGPIDILVNNTGAQHRANFTVFSEVDWQRLLDTNLTSAFLVGREVASRMVARGRGKIVNVCSLQSEVARAGIAPYAATKGALKMLTKGMCADLARSGIQVNGIGPGYIATELTAALVDDEQFSAWVRQRTPAGRWGTMADLVGALIFLCSPAADFVNGQILYVDGGMLAVL